MSEKVGRNDPCPCGSGKKYKSCCLMKQEQKKTSTLTGKRKFTAKLISGGGIKPVQQASSGEQQGMVDYNVLMERSFGKAFQEDEKPPIPEMNQYLPKENKE